MKLLWGLVLASSVAAVALAASAADPAIDVAEPWARPTVAGMATGAAYFTLTNHGAVADRLIAAAMPLAERTEIHDTVMDGTVMRMRKLDALAVPPHVPVALKPGGTHVMFFGLKEPLRPGAKIPLTLTFANAGNVTIEVTVSPAAGAGTAPAHGGHGGDHR